MRTAHKLALLLALALAAIAVTAAPASATATNTLDITPAGDFAASSPAADLQSNDTTMTFSCTSTLGATIDAAGSGTINSLDFNDEDCSGLCTVDTAVTGLPATFTMTTAETVDTADDDATMTVAANVINLVFTCGAPLGDCGFSPPGDIQGNVTEGDQTITFVDVRWNRTSGSMACGTDLTWNTTYTLTAPVGGLTLRPLP